MTRDPHWSAADEITRSTLPAHQVTTNIARAKAAQQQIEAARAADENPAKPAPEIK
jgi:hypothetical protein